MNQQQVFIPEVIVPQTPKIVAPVLTDYAHHDVSTRYIHVNTMDVVNAARETGWEVVKTSAARVRDPGREGFQKHFVTMRHSKQKLEVGDCEMRMLLVNSHDGKSSIQMFASLFRLVCTNGMVIDQGQFAAIRLRHMEEDIYQKVVDGAQKVAALAPAIDANIKKMQTIELTPEQQLVFAQRSIKAVWPDRSETYVTPESVLRARRFADQGNTVWVTYNRVQENLIRGGLATTNGRHTRGIRGAIKDLSVNTELFDIAASFAV